MSRSHRWLMLGLLVFLGTAAAQVSEQEPEDAPPLRSATVPATDYKESKVRGFSLRLAPRLCAGGKEEALGKRALDALDRDLGAALEQVPKSARAALKSVPIFVGTNDPVAPCACYHPSAGWLRANGYDLAKAKAVEITNAETYLSWRRAQPSMLLHELAHGYHDQVVGKQNPRVIAALNRARKGGAYDRVLRWSGETASHYALSNADEYFAETTEALFGVNDFYPFIRPELLQVDPEGAKLIAELWGANIQAPKGKTMEEMIRAEVPRLHVAFEEWFDKDGTPPDFGEISRALARPFQMVLPSGAMVGRKEILGMIRSGKSARLIRISAEVQSVTPLGPNQALAVYLERQQEGGAERVIISTALFRRAPEAPGGVEWIHVHETLRR